MSSLGWDLDRGRWLGGGDSSITPLRMAAKSLPIVIRDPLVRVISDKVISLTTISFIGRKFGTHFRRIKKSRLYSQFGTKRLSLMCKGPTSRRPQFLSNACFAFRTLVNPLSISFGIVSKLGECGDELLVSCTSFAGCADWEL